MTAENQLLDSIRKREEKDPKNLVQSFIVEQFNKLSRQENLGLNSRVKRTFTRP